jgi:hypothetical protein
MIHRWQLKTSESPFRLDLNKLDNERKLLLNEKENNRRMEQDKINMMKNMTGTLKFDIFDKEMIESFEDIETQLSLELRKDINDSKVISMEQRQLNNLIENEINVAYRKFPSMYPYHNSIYDENNSTLASLKSVSIYNNKNNIGSKSKEKNTINKASPIFKTAIDEFDNEYQ